ncbi:predicted capsid assembly protein [Salmonella phage Vi06]|uniref:Predicted capsid assembly protein n=1 Tax=Salmonella phage Vi06 TaxID=866889 RepID=E1XUB1_9CAUD|nr:head assembly [Salmonella phage Vi06]CBV65232.1 predicted capsid assembly protein [Salmonella phage Vi06]
MAESNADVYASFGVNSAVLSGGSVGEHEQKMLALDVAARDGDDAINLESSDGVETERGLYDNSDPFGQEDDDGRIQVRIGDGSEPTEVDTEEEVEDPEGTEGSEEFTPLGETPEELVAASKQLGKHEEGFQEMINIAAERGMSTETIEAIQREYEENEELSAESYAKLAEIGYTKAFIDSYIRGQEALVEQYVNSIVEYAGGRERFDALYKHLETHNPEAAQSLDNALTNRDLATVKAIINLAGESRAKAFGRKPARSVTSRAIPAKPQATKSEGFEGRDEMIKAMSDPRYRTDSKYRQAVEQRVWASNF